MQTWTNIHNAPPGGLDEENRRFSFMPLDMDEHASVQPNGTLGTMYGVTDEDAGGVIAYATTSEMASFIAWALRMKHEVY